MPEAASQDSSDAQLELVLRPIRSRNLFEETIGRLGQAIQLGIIEPGERFPPERELAEMLGVSRVVVREALRALEQAGRIEIRRGRQGGAFITKSRASPRSDASARRIVRQLGQSLDDLFEYRWAIEPAAASIAAEKAVESDVVHLRQVYEASTHTTQEGYRAADVRIHLVIAEIAQSTLVASAVAEVQARFSELFLAIPILNESVRHSHTQHLEVIDAIAAGDRAGARQAMEEHVLASEELIRALA